MKGLSVKDLVSQEPEAIRAQIRKMEEELFQARMKHNTNQLENTAQIRNTRRNIARANTALKLRESQPAKKE